MNHETYVQQSLNSCDAPPAIVPYLPSVRSAANSFAQKGKQKKAVADITEWRKAQWQIDKDNLAHTSRISSNDPHAIDKLKQKLILLERKQKTMKQVNTYFRKHGTLKGCKFLSSHEMKKLQSTMAQHLCTENKPFASCTLAYKSAEIRRVKKRISELSHSKTTIIQRSALRQRRYRRQSPQQVAACLFQKKSSNRKIRLLKRNRTPMSVRNKYMAQAVCH